MMHPEHCCFEQDDSTGQYCVKYEKVLDNGVGVLLQQCLFASTGSVVFGSNTFSVPEDYTKVLHWHGFDSE